MLKLRRLGVVDLTRINHIQLDCNLLSMRKML